MEVADIYKLGEYVIERQSSYVNYVRDQLWIQYEWLIIGNRTDNVGCRDKE